MPEMNVSMIIATNNQHKLNEIRKMLPLSFTLETLKDAGLNFELPETSGTIEGNALQKARTVYHHTGKTTLADDSGLLVEALDNQPGVDSAIYAGLPRDDRRNVDKLLSELSGIDNRRAAFITVLALIMDGQEYLFEGRVNGRITESLSGAGGFGYDPVFVPDGHSITFAEMSDDEKNAISHRANAVRKLQEFFAK